MFKNSLFYLVLLITAGCLAQEIQIVLECHDCVIGEQGIAAYELFKFTIVNTSDKPVKLTTENSTDWLYNSTRWTLHAEGPLDKRCIGERAVAYGDPGPGGHPFIEIPAKGKWISNYGALGWGNPGAYSIWIEYDGTKAVEGDYKTRVRSNTCTFNIRQPEGVDAEIFNTWRKQNPDGPDCLFPKGMEMDIYKPEVVVEKYPDSIYAAWAVYKYLGAPEKWPIEKLMELLPKGLYPQSNSVPYSGAKGGWRSLKGDDMAQWQNEWAERIIQNHPNFPFIERLKIIMAVNYYKLQQRQKGFDLLDGIIKGKGVEATWAMKFLDLIEKEKKPQAQMIP